jgi:hypothetical protein
MSQHQPAAWFIAQHSTCCHPPPPIPMTFGHWCQLSLQSIAALAQKHRDYAAFFAAKKYCQSHTATTARPPAARPRTIRSFRGTPWTARQQQQQQKQQQQHTENSQHHSTLLTAPSSASGSSLGHATALINQSINQSIDQLMNVTVLAVPTQCAPFGAGACTLELCRIIWCGEYRSVVKEFTCNTKPPNAPRASTSVIKVPSIAYPTKIANSKPRIQSANQSHSGTHTLPLWKQRFVYASHTGQSGNGGLTRYTICHKPQSCSAASTAMARLSCLNVDAPSLPRSAASLSVYHTTPAGCHWHWRDTP